MPGPGRCGGRAAGSGGSPCRWGVGSSPVVWFALAGRAAAASGGAQCRWGVGSPPVRANRVTGPSTPGPASRRTPWRPPGRPRWRTRSSATRRAARAPGSGRRPEPHQLLGGGDAQRAVGGDALGQGEGGGEDLVGRHHLVDEPQLEARPASIVSPVSVISRATASGTRWPMNVPPPAAKSPRCTSGRPNAPRTRRRRGRSRAAAPARRPPRCRWPRRRSAWRPRPGPTA